MKFNYYYNNVPGKGLCRNNLIYTSLISEDKKTFVQWYYNDSDYHKGKNEVVDAAKMEEKWLREIKYLELVSREFPDHVPKYDIDIAAKKIYLEISGVDFWEQAGCNHNNFDSVLPNWQEQMLDILQSHKSLDLYKYSLHPSSYFIVDGKLKSINYFFTYHKNEGPISIIDHASHISNGRQDEMKEHITNLNLSWDKPESLDTLQLLCFESFRTNYASSFIDKAKRIYFD
jgi:hypothetical protein